MIGLPELIIVLFILFVPIWLLAFLDILRNDFKGNEKLTWLLAVILVPLLGPICYFIFGWKQKIRDRTDVKNT